MSSELDNKPNSIIELCNKILEECDPANHYSPRFDYVHKLAAQIKAQVEGAITMYETSGDWVTEDLILACEGTIKHFCRAKLIAIEEIG